MWTIFRSLVVHVTITQRLSSRGFATHTYLLKDQYYEFRMNYGSPK